MTRPKVAPDKRQRTAIACDLCKRRKQKCNGQLPCGNCIRRSLNCTYGPSEVDYGRGNSASKRRMVEPPQAWSQGWEDTKTPTSSSNPLIQDATPFADIDHAASGDIRVWGKLSRATNSLNGEEEAFVYNSSRMLQDPSGRLLYIGDAATLSFLQLVRMVVESTEGVSPFTLDPRRHRIVENTLSLPENARTTQLLPPRETAIILLDSFFDHTCGLVEVVNRTAFMHDVENCYSDPHSVDPSWLCLLYLVFATGLVFATPIPGTKEDLVIQKLRSEPLDRAEIFYSNAKNLGDPSTFENPDLWSIQTLLIMTLYMLAVAKRNRAYTLHGMAVRSAFALGLHREESMVIFTPEEQTLRRNLWRSLFVLDRFLSVSLGRPTSISEDDCSESLLKVDGMAVAAGSLETQGLGACIRSCHFIGLILEKVYAKRKISTKLGQELADLCKTWSKCLDSRLHWEQIAPIPLNQAIAILNVNMFYCHSIVLLTRPFFLSVLRKIEQERVKGHILSSRRSGHMERFSESCLVASCHSIILVQKAMESRTLSRRNPFVTYFLFSAALIVLCNEYAKLHNLHSPTSAETCIKNALNSMNFMAEADPQAQRLHYVLKCFYDVVINRNKKINMPPPQIPTTSASHGHPSPNIFRATEGARMEIPTTAPISQEDGGVSPYRTSHPTPAPPRNQPPSLPIDAALSYDSERTLSDPTTVTPQSFGNVNSPDAFFDFQTFSFSSMSGTDQTSPDLNDPTEIDFEALWNWPRTLSHDPLDQMDAVPQDTAVPLYSTEFAGLGGFQDDRQFMA